MKATIKKAITGILAAAMCAVPMTSAMSASAAERIVNLDKSLQLELKKADLTKIVVTGMIGTDKASDVAVTTNAKVTAPKYVKDSAKVFSLLFGKSSTD